MDEELRLNLGSRDRVIPGFKNMDIEQHTGVDYVGDVSDLSRFEDNSVSEIYAGNILEHFPHSKTLAVLKEWRRVLKPGGKLSLSVPDFHRALEIYRKCGMCDWVENFLMGDQAYPHAFHYALFDDARISQRLIEAGFTDFNKVKSFGFVELKDCSNLVSTLDLKPVCINVVALK